MKKILFSKADVISLFVICFSFAVSFYFYSHFPERVPTHWNFAGVADGWSGRGFAAFFFPIVVLGIYALISIAPFLDPKKERYEEFAKAYGMIKIIIVSFMTLVYVVVGLAGTGVPIDVGFLVPVLVGLFFIALGNYMGKIKMNWMVGMRNPWTLSSEEVWNKTSCLAGKTMMCAGVLFFVMSYVSTGWRPVLLIGAIAIIILVPNIYSFVLFRKLQTKNSRN
jgi:uncharacterized membrane protein